jgi:hypothetical protein
VAGGWERREKAAGMAGEDLVGQWTPTLRAVAESMAAWRREHPRATLTEIEAAARERMRPVEAKMIADAAQTSPAADLAAMPRSRRPRCEQCGGALISRGKQERVLQAESGERLRLRRSYGVCEQCGLESFPPG